MAKIGSMELIVILIVAMLAIGPAVSYTHLTLPTTSIV